MGDQMEHYDKLVRDAIPDIIRAAGETPVIRTIADDAEYLAALLVKLFEEAAELAEKPSLEELADAHEVVRSIGKVLGYTPEQIETARLEKKAERGGFDKRIFLTRVEHHDREA
jgi:predicted house-cleaning noncanonical NTP pyrophosphatase (MazG superfamily)